MDLNDEPPAFSEEGAAPQAVDELAGPHAAADEEVGTDSKGEEDYEGYDSDAFEGFDSDAAFEDVGPRADPVATALDAFRKEQGWLDKAGEPSLASEDSPIPFQHLRLTAPPATLAFLHLPALVAKLVSELSLSHADLRSLALVASSFVHAVQKHIFRHLQIDTVAQSGRLLEIFASRPALAEMNHSMELALGNVRGTIKEILLIRATVESLREQQDLLQDREWEDEGRRQLGQDATGEELDRLRMANLLDSVLRELSTEDFRDAEAHLNNIYLWHPFSINSGTFLSYEPGFVDSLTFLSKPTSIKLSFPASTVPHLFLPHLSPSLTSLTIHHPTKDSQLQQLSSASEEYNFPLGSAIPPSSLSSGQDLTIKDASTSLRSLDLQNIMLVCEGTYDQPATWQLEECRFLGVGVRRFGSGWGGAQGLGGAWTGGWGNAWTGETVEDAEREEGDIRMRQGWGIEGEVGPSLVEVGDAAVALAPDEELPALVSDDGDKIPPLVLSDALSDPQSASTQPHDSNYWTLHQTPSSFVPPSSSVPRRSTPRLSLALFLGPVHNTHPVLHLDLTSVVSDSSILAALAAYSTTLECLSITRRGAWKPTSEWEVRETRPTELEGKGKGEISDFAKVLRTCGALREVRLVDDEGVPSWDADDEGVPSWDADAVDTLGKGGARLEWVGVRVRADGRTAGVGGVGEEGAEACWGEGEDQGRLGGGGGDFKLLGLLLSWNSSLAPSSPSHIVRSVAAGSSPSRSNTSSPVWGKGKHRTFVRSTPRAFSSPVLSFFSTRLGIALLSIALTLLITRLLSTSPGGTVVTTYDLTPLTASPRGHLANQKLLILTPLKDGGPWLDEYFDNLDYLNYPPHLISLGFLVSDSGDDTLSKLKAHAARLARRPKGRQYDSITILQRDFHFNLASEARHGFEGQPVRRAFIARARNYLLTGTLRHDHAWVLWLDVDVVRYDPDIVMDLMGVNKDIVVPNTLWHQEKSWEFWGFDRNSFAETEESLELIAKLGPDTLLVEGYRELHTARSHLVDMPTHLGLADVPLDGIGCTFTLVKAHVHREGVTFPTYVFENEIETEGLAKVAKKAGFEVVGVPGVLVFHAQNH